MADQFTVADINEPSNEWKKGAESEYKLLIDNHTWDLVPPPEDKTVIGSKWVSKSREKLMELFKDSRED